MFCTRRKILAGIAPATIISWICSPNLSFGQARALERMWDKNFNITYIDTKKKADMFLEVMIFKEKDGGETSLVFIQKTMYLETGGIKNREGGETQYSSIEGLRIRDEIARDIKKREGKAEFKPPRFNEKPDRYILLQVLGEKAVFVSETDEDFGKYITLLKKAYERKK